MPGKGSTYDKVFESTKTYVHAIGLSACFRQWRAKSHCRFMHGYALEVKLTFRTTTLDQNNWVMDFGGLKPIKAWLEETFDHKTLVAIDDPSLELFQALHLAGIIQMVSVKNVGCEGFAEMVFDHVVAWLLTTEHKDRVWLCSAEVREHQGNSAVVHAIPTGGFVGVHDYGR